MPKYTDVDETGLREVDKLIVLDYLNNGFNKKRAYAGYHKDQSPNSHETLSQRFFKREPVRKYLNDFIKKIQEKKEISAASTIREISDMAYGKPIDKLTHDHKLKALHELAEIQKLKDPEAPPPDPNAETDNVQPAIQIILPDNRRCDYVIKTK